MTGPVAVETMADFKISQRKFKKHMVEKKRRNRINYALEQLKTIVLSDLGKDVSTFCIHYYVSALKYIHILEMCFN